MATIKERIFSIADGLISEGVSPTLSAVRKALGGGSFTTISDAMTEWRTRQSVQTTPLREPLPQSVTDKLANLGGEIWSAALEVANGRLAAEREAFNVQCQELEAAKQESAELADQLSAELEQANARIAALEHKASEAETVKADLREEVGKANARADELRTTAERAQKEADKARAGEAKAREDAAELRGRVNALESVLKHTTPDLGASSGSISVC